MKRGIKYPERIMNSSKSATSLMLSVTAAGELLPIYTVYKAEKLWDTWTENGPKAARYNRSRSGWFDNECFYDWFMKVALPFCRKKTGRCVLIGDNLSSHFSPDIIRICAENNISFCCLPPNATHLCQPLDVAFFRPLKEKWRSILTAYKTSRGKKAQTIQKDKFPGLLKQLMDAISVNAADNIKAGFRKSGIYPTDPEPVLMRIPHNGEDEDSVNTSVAETFLAHLQEMRYGKDDEVTKRRKQRLDVEPGKSVAGPSDEVIDMHESSSSSTASNSERVVVVDQPEDDVPINLPVSDVTFSDSGDEEWVPAPKKRSFSNIFDQFTQ